MAEEEKELDLPNILGKAEKKIVDQIEKEYQYALKVQKSKVDEWLDRLKVYSNQRKQKTSVGDPLLFTAFQTILASLYDDKLEVAFGPREGGDIDVAENLDQLAEFDYDLMGKDVLDYDWIWDTLFFGRGFLLFTEFDRKKMVPVPEIISPLLLLRDPKAISVNGNVKGFGGARFLGREMALIKWQMEKNKDYFNLGQIKKYEDQDSLIKKSDTARREAQGRDNVWDEEEKLEDNAYYNCLEWYTHMEGEKYLITLANKRTKVIRFTKLKDQDKWPIIDRTIFPISHEWDGVSIPDLIEDKQRARAKLINMGLETAAANANPMYVFDTNKIKRRDFLDFQFNKFIPVDGSADGAVTPMVKDRIGQEVQWILNLLDEGSQRALATPEIQQGVMTKQQRTLGELELMSSKVDTRYSLSAKIFGWSERRFWEKWYWLYKNHFKSKIDEKIIRLVGVWGPEFRELTRENIIAKVDPDIRIESAAVNKSKKMAQRELFRGFIQMTVGMPDFPIRYALKELAKLSDFRDDQVKVLFPPNYEEMKAEKENEILEKGGMPTVSLMDDHMAHLLYHAKLNQSDIRDRHIDFHYEAMRLQKENPSMFPPEGQEQLGEPQTQMPEAKLRQPAAGAREPARRARVPEAYKDARTPE